MTREEAIKWLKDIHHRFNPTGENLENEGGDVHLQALDLAIEALQTEIVRCGECKHMIADGRCMEFADDGIRPSATDFCSYGERKGGDSE